MATDAGRRFFSDRGPPLHFDIRIGGQNHRPQGFLFAIAKGTVVDDFGETSTRSAPKSALPGWEITVIHSS